MKTKITQTERLPHLEREEVTAEIEFKDSTPSREKVRKEIAKKHGAEESLVFVRNIYTTFGESKAKVLACVYSNEDAMKNVEQKAMVARHSKQEAAAEGGSEEEADQSGKESEDSEKDNSGDEEEPSDDSDEPKGDGEDDTADEGSSEEEKEE